MRRGGFWLVTYVFVTVMVGATLPTPLYVLYQARWHFSSGIVTLIFASYAAGVLAALLLAGRASDQVGRRPVLAAAVGFSAASTLAFILAGSTAWLFAGRVLSGVAAGLVTGTGTATLSEFAGPASLRRASVVATAAATGGLGLGPAIAGFFAEYAPHPTTLVFDVYLVLLVGAVVALAFVPETVEARQRLAIGFVGLRLPDAGRGEFLAAGVAGLASLALLGLFTALAPSFLGGVLDVHNRAATGSVVFMLFAASTVAQIALGRTAPSRSTTAGLGLYLVALALIVVALSVESLALFLPATVIGGLAAGAAFVGSLSTANRLAPAHSRGQVVSTYFVFAYVGLTIPVIAIGFTADEIGFLRAVSYSSVAMAALCVGTLWVLRQRRSLVAGAE